MGALVFFRVARAYLLPEEAQKILPTLQSLRPIIFAYVHRLVLNKEFMLSKITIL